MSALSSRVVLLFSSLLACSLAFALTPNTGDIATFCLNVKAGYRQVASMPVTLGSKLSLSFVNSVYGSPVEEIFGLTQDGLQSSRLLYAEPRLVEFYGHEAASYEDGVWVVTPAPRRFNPLRLRVSRDSAIHVSLNGRVISIPESAEAGAELSIASCEATHG